MLSKCQKLLILLIAFSLLVPVGASAQIASNCTLNPDSATPLGGIPPQPGVEIFIFSTAQTGVQYTFECDVTEQPASVVVLPATINSLLFESGKLTLVFTNTSYIEGSNVPAPPGQTTFSIAIIPADPNGTGIPNEMRGSWMATNIPPVGVDPSGAGGWELIPPSQANPYFGYKLNGPAGSSGFFKMFIPDNMRQLLEQLINLKANPPVSLTWNDLAVFNNDQQASMAITEQGDGALVDINVNFTDGSTDIEDQSSQLDLLPRRARVGGGIDKKITVGRAKPISLTASNTKPRKGSTLRLYGWVQNCQPGEKVSLTSTQALKKAKAKGAKSLARYKKKGWKELRLRNDCGYSHSYKIKNNDVFQTLLKRKKQRVIKSDRLKVKVSKR